MNRHVDNLDASPPGRAKKYYTRPELRIYGDLEKITLSVDMTGHKDSGSGTPGMNKTAG